MNRSHRSMSRIDMLLVERGLVPSRARAQAVVMAGLVDVDGVRVDKAGTRVFTDAAVHLRTSGPTYVSRGGDKLQGALVSFAPHGLCVHGSVVADFGASTGGFADCLLQHGAQRVHAIDVGHGLLHERIRSDPRVVVWERTNARYITQETLGESVDLVVIDASFIGLSKLLGAAHAVLRDQGQVLALIKPQFEAGRREVSRGRGVIRDDETRAAVICETMAGIEAAGFDLIADAACVIPGPKGNHEHFAFVRKR